MMMVQSPLYQHTLTVTDRMADSSVFNSADEADFPFFPIWRAVDANSPDTLRELMKSDIWTGAALNSLHGRCLPHAEGKPWQHMTPLIRAISLGYLDCVVALLVHPLVDVNAGDWDGATPLYYCAYSLPTPDNLKMMTLLCGHPLIDVNRVDSENTSPLWISCYDGYFDNVRCLLATSPLGSVNLDIRAVSRLQQGSWCGFDGKTALEVTWDLRCQRLLCDFQTHPRETRVRLRRELALPSEEVAEAFACAVLLSDGYLQRRSLSAVEHSRFWGIITRLPMELQMLLCHRLYESSGQTVLARNVEAGLRNVLADFLFVPLILFE